MTPKKGENIRLCGLIGGSLTMGTGIWAIHFIGMLAYHLPVAIAYDLPIVVVSWLAAVIASGSPLQLVSRFGTQVLVVNPRYSDGLWH